MNERHELTIERIGRMLVEETVAPLYRDYFRFVAKFLLNVNDIYCEVCKRSLRNYDVEQLKRENETVYDDIRVEKYERSYANPAYTVSLFGQEMGQFLSFLYTEMRAQIAYAYEKRLSYLTICNELFIEIYNCFEDEEIPNLKNLKEIVYWFASDYCDVFVAERMEEKMNPEKSFATDIVMQADLSDGGYLYLYGEPISQREYKAVTFFNSMSMQKIDEMANVYVQSYLESCEEIGMELKGEETIQVQYAIGTERLVRAIIDKFQKNGLAVTVCRNAVSALNRESERIGFYSRSMNPQYELDHSMDQGIFLNKKFVERKLDVMKNVYEQHMKLTSNFAGCVSIGIEEDEILYEMQDEAIKLSEKQIALQMLYSEKMEQLTNKYLLKELNIRVVDIE